MELGTWPPREAWYKVAAILSLLIVALIVQGWIK